MNLTETIRARVELPCSIRLSKTDLRIVTGLTEELARESLTAVMPSTSGVSWMKAGASVLIRVELPFASRHNHRVLQCESIICWAGTSTDGMRVVANVHHMTVIDGDMGIRLRSRFVTRSCRAKSVSAINRSLHTYSVIPENHLTESYSNRGEHTMSLLKNLFIEEDGQDMVEYGLIIALVVLAATAAFTTFGADIITGIGKLSAKVVTSVQ